MNSHPTSARMASADSGLTANRRRQIEDQVIYCNVLYWKIGQRAHRKLGVLLDPVQSRAERMAAALAECVADLDRRAAS